ncbi:hypothetical protein ABZ914_03990 [Spirillospora sp. NPDC046719]
MTGQMSAAAGARGASGGATVGRAHRPSTPTKPLAEQLTAAKRELDRLRAALQTAKADRDRARTAEDKTKKEIVRCLKRYVAREVYQVIIRSTALLPRVAQT